MLEWFELTNVDVKPKENTVTQDTQSEESPVNVIHLYLDENNLTPDNREDLRPNGFTTILIVTAEDRSILLSRLVRDLLALKVVLVYYPGHLATAIHFSNDVRGDYLMLSGTRYTICDPTYIGASVGMTMPDMDNSKATVILLE
jgi:hypothetical protein